MNPIYVEKTFRNTDITENQRDFLIELRDSIKNLFPDVDSLASPGVVATKKHTGGVNRKNCMRWGIYNEDFSLQFNQYGKRSMELYCISVNKKGKGIGSRLMNIIDQVSKETKTTIFLRPMEIDSTPLSVLHTFYKKYGFKRTSNSMYWSNISNFQ